MDKVPMFKEHLLNQIREAKHPRDIVTAADYGTEERAAAALAVADNEIEQRAAWSLVRALAMPAVTLWWGLAAATLWRWFVVPLGAPVVGVGAAGGIFLLLILLRGGPAGIKGFETAKEDRTALTHSLILPALFMAVGRLCLWIGQP